MRERIFAQDVSSCFHCPFSAIPFLVVRQYSPPPMWTLQLDLHCGAGDDRERHLEKRLLEEREKCWACFLEEEEMMMIRVAERWIDKRWGPACCPRSAYPVSLNVCVCVVKVFFFLLFCQPKSSDLNGHSQRFQVVGSHTPQARSFFFKQHSAEPPDGYVL